MNEVGSIEVETVRDPLTGLPGLEAVSARVAEWNVQAQTVSLHGLLLGLRRFDAVNLAHGAAAGDVALAEVAARVSHFAAGELDGSFLVARSGGSNFLVIANWACSRERWRLFAEQLADIVARPITAPRGLVRLSPRVALLRALPDEAAESLLDRLGQALTTAEGQQGRRIVWADGETTRPGRSAAQLEADLLAAIDGDEIEVVFQPQFSLPEERLTGAEALARWNHPRLGRIGASSLFAIAERSDHLAPISLHIARLALQAASRWRADLRLSLNVTATDLAVASFGEELAQIVAASTFPPERLTLEVTEQALLSDIQLAERTLRRLSAAGMRIALDDFGAGFCNFRYLKLLPLDYLKLDRSMVDGITSDPRDLAVLRAIVAMARALQLDVIAEGIETEAQRDCIAAEGCAFYQGFLKAQPMTAAEFADFSSSRT
jgi:predicted signal transduction protein with EAL and GGDEF domain